MARFDVISRIYDLLPIPTHARRVAEHIRDAPGPILDLGGGTGRFTATFAGEDREAVVLDLSPGMLERGRRAGRTHAAVNGRAEAMPFADDSFGGVAMTEAFHHFAPHQGAVLAEISRVLRPDGDLVLEEIDPSTFRGRLVDGFERVMRFGSTFLKPDDLVGLVSEHFADVEWSWSSSYTYIVHAREPRTP